MTAQTQTLTYTIPFISDPGHGWGRVARSAIKDAGIADQISQYSYQEGDHLVYLEEDCDLYLFIRALEQRGYKVKLDEQYVDRTHIRALPRYKETQQEKQT
jgi:hypothetical protein